MIEEKTVQYAKEIDDVMALIVETIKTIKEKGSYTSLVDDFIRAIKDLDQTSEEVKNHKAVVNTVAPRIYDIVEIFTKKGE